jgi:hypothetical protein
MLLTAAAKAAGQQHPLTPFSANPSWQQGQKGRRKQRGRQSGNQENKGTNPEKN